MVLVVDEADKAPTHVTCILKNIVEGSEMTLADGRRIIHSKEGVWLLLLSLSLYFHYMYVFTVEY